MSGAPRPSSTVALNFVTGCERRHVVHLLVHLAEFCFRVAPAGECDHRRMREVRVAQAGGEVERADHLRHADARPADARA